MASSSSSSSSSALASNRPFPTDDNIIIDVVSQSIKDTFNLKKSVNIKTVSGSMSVEVVPSPTPTTSLTRKLTTFSTSGSLSLDVVTSLGPFLMDASHTTTSGSIKASYPSDWCGTIELVLLSGSYRLKSELGDVRVVSDIVDHSNGERKILALKGNPSGEYSTLKIQSKSGSVALKFDKKPPLRNLTDEESKVEDEARRRAEGNKEKKEIQGAAVTRASTSNTVAPLPLAPPPLIGRPAPPPAGELPPSYDQSEAENVLSQVAGRD